MTVARNIDYPLRIRKVARAEEISDLMAVLIAGRLAQVQRRPRHGPSRRTKRYRRSSLTN